MLPSNYGNSRAVAGPKGHKTNPSAIVRKSWPPSYNSNVAQTAVAAAATNAYKTTVAGPNTATVVYKGTLSQIVGGAVFDGALATGTPDVSRNVVITVTHGSSVVALSGVISGYDFAGRNITEAWSVTATGTTKTFTGAKAFYIVDNVSVIAAADASADSVIIGTGNVLGFTTICSCPSAVKELVDGSVVTNGTLVAGSHSSTTADYIGTYTPNTAPNGTHTYDVWYISDQPETT